MPLFPSAKPPIRTHIFLAGARELGVAGQLVGTRGPLSVYPLRVPGRWALCGFPDEQHGSVTADGSPLTSAALSAVVPPPWLCLTGGGEGGGNSCNKKKYF